MKPDTKILSASLAYLLPVFGAGWAIGPFRELIAIPRVGRLAATAGEAVLMSAAIYSSARAAAARLDENVPSARLAVGLSAFTMLCPLEVVGARFARRLPLRAYLESFRSPSGAISAALFVWFALAPLLAGKSSSNSEQSASATIMERTEALPGDELIHRPIASLTHAIDIDAPRNAVWPWLAQMGSGRAGWYSYDIVDNGGRPSAKRIVQSLQEPKIGSIFPWSPGATEGFTLLDFEPEHFLLLGWLAANASAPRVTWAFVLKSNDDGTATRLIVRARAGADYTYLGMPQAIGRLIVPLVHDVMQRKQLRDIARRARS